MIVPGVTTSGDVVGGSAKKFAILVTTPWFHPTVDIQRADPDNKEANAVFRAVRKRCNPSGDLIHVDIGITNLRLNTDIQQHAYVLRPEKRACQSRSKRPSPRPTDYKTF